MPALVPGLEGPALVLAKAVAAAMRVAVSEVQELVAAMPVVVIEVQQLVVAMQEVVIRALQLAEAMRGVVTTMVFVPVVVLKGVWLTLEVACLLGSLTVVSRLLALVVEWAQQPVLALR